MHLPIPTQSVRLSTQCRLRWLGTAIVLSMLAACGPWSGNSSGANAAVAAPFKPVASLQELMAAEVDASADELWDAVEIDVSAAGTQQVQPNSAEEWNKLRPRAITLVEAANLLMISGRRVSNQPFAAEAAGALDSSQIAQRIADRPAAFNGYAQALQDSGARMLAAIDHQDAHEFLKEGGTLDQICEACHLTFWYPNQVIPPLPADRASSKP
jgi:hypothetical protein